MIYPKFIKEGDFIGVTAPSDGIIDDIGVCRLEYAINNIEAAGYNVIETDNVRKSVLGRSSSSKERALELKKLFCDDRIKLIICASGGDFLLEMLSDFDFLVVKDNIKWIQGYSDPTALLYTITTNFDIATIYGNNFTSFGMQPWHNSLKLNFEILNGERLEQSSFDKYESSRIEYIVGNEGYKLEEKVFWKSLFDEKVQMKGRVIGGCIDILNDLFGTRFDKTKEFIEKYKDDGILWYFDSCELSSEQLIRTLWKFKDNGWFKFCRGIIFGRIFFGKSYYGISFMEAVSSSLKDLDIPVILDADLGHVSPRMIIINGAIAEIDVHDGKGRIKYILK